MSTQAAAVLQVERAGVAAQAPLTVTNGNSITFPNDGNVIVQITNGDSAAATATVISTATISGEALADRAVAVSAGATVLCGPWPPVLYNDSDGLVTITLSGVGCSFRFYGI